MRKAHLLAFSSFIWKSLNPLLMKARKLFQGYEQALVSEFTVVRNPIWAHLTPQPKAWGWCTVLIFGQISLAMQTKSQWSWVPIPDAGCLAHIVVALCWALWLWDRLWERPPARAWHSQIWPFHAMCQCQDFRTLQDCGTYKFLGSS